MKPYFKILIAILVLMTNFGNIQSQTLMKINYANGSSESIPIDEIQKITFENLGLVSNEQIKHFSIILNEVKVFPNPTNKKVTIYYQLLQQENTYIKIVNLAGELVFKEDFGVLNIGNQTFEWDLNNINGKPVVEGTYICIVYSKNQKLSTKIIVIK
jgi:hypothetical protein